MHKLNRMFAPLSLALLALPAAAQAPELAAPAWTVDKAQSQLGFSAVSDGEPFTGRFGDWDARIAFDSADLAASSAKVTIAMGSVATEDPSRADSLQEGTWFSTAMFPEATFETSAIRAEGDGYVADGTLTIRDQSMPVSMPFDLAIEGDVARMKGALTIDRKDFGLGVGGWQDSHVDPNVTIEVAVIARKAG